VSVAPVECIAATRYVKAPLDSNGYPKRPTQAHDFVERDRQAIERRLVRRLERPGYHVALEPLQAT
jgi:hypothetical protein